jgi:hypothetical protein
MFLPLLAEAIRQPVKPADLHPHREVLALHVGRANAVAIRVADNWNHPLLRRPQRGGSGACIRESRGNWAKSTRSLRVLSIAEGNRDQLAYFRRAADQSREASESCFCFNALFTHYPLANSLPTAQYIDRVSVRPCEPAWWPAFALSPMPVRKPARQPGGSPHDCAGCPSRLAVHRNVGGYRCLSIYLLQSKPERKPARCRDESSSAVPWRPDWAPPPLRRPRTRPRPLPRRASRRNSLRRRTRIRPRGTIPSARRTTTPTRTISSSNATSPANRTRARCCRCPGSLRRHPSVRGRPRRQAHRRGLYRLPHPHLER